MNGDFLQIKSLEGELKISHKKKDFGLTVSTMELVYQKPHVNYIILLEHIVTITPFRPGNGQHVRRTLNNVTSFELKGLTTGKDHYRLYASEAVMHSRSGRFELGPTEFILPLLPNVLQAIAQYGQLNVVQ